MERRRKQIEFFRNDALIMLATDAGGEFFINLQFCNQIINYDLPRTPLGNNEWVGFIVSTKE